MRFKKSKEKYTHKEYWVATDKWGLWYSIQKHGDIMTE